MNNDLVEGLRVALAKGHTLEQAMMSFYNAGYIKEEIEEAARVLVYHPSQTLAHPEKPTPEHLTKPAKALPIQKQAKPLKEKPATKSVSVYDETKNPRSKTIILLISVLFILLVLLGSLILFKDSLINFFTNLF